MRVGVIGGTGVYAWMKGERVEVETPYGSVTFEHTRRGATDWFFLPRHGWHHETPPHRVNGRAQLRAFKEARVDTLFAIFCTGALDPSLKTGTWVVPDDLFDHTTGRVRTFHDETAVHVNSARPYCPRLRKALLKTGPSGVKDGASTLRWTGPNWRHACRPRRTRTWKAR